MRECWDPLERAERICKTILHEFRHIFQFQSNTFGKYNEKLHWVNRPQERDAEFFAKYEAKIEEELILNLAIELERLSKNRKKSK